MDKDFKNLLKMAWAFFSSIVLYASIMYVGSKFGAQFSDADINTFAVFCVVLYFFANIMIVLLND